MVATREQRTNLILLASGGGVFLVILLLDLFAGVQTPFPWSLLLLVCCAAIGIAIARHVMSKGAASETSDPGIEEETL